MNQRRIVVDGIEKNYEENIATENHFLSNLYNQCYFT